MYIPTPKEAVSTISAYFIPNGERSYLDLATVANSSAKKLQELADKELDIDRKKALLKAVKARKKAEKDYIEKYMSGKVWNPMPRF